MKNRCKIDARKSDAKMMKNRAKTEAKWEPKSVQNREKSEISLKNHEKIRKKHKIKSIQNTLLLEGLNKMRKNVNLHIF